MSIIDKKVITPKKTDYNKIVIPKECFFMIKPGSVVSMVIISLFLSACTPQRSLQYMTISKQEFKQLKKKRPKNLYLKNNLIIERVTCDNKIEALDSPKLNSNDLEIALKESLINAALYSNHAAKIRFRLKAKLVKLDYPDFITDHKIVSHINYKVYDNNKKQTVFEKTLSVPYIAKSGESQPDIEKLQLVNDESIKENIKEFINDLYEI